MDPNVSLTEFEKTTRNGLLPLLLEQETQTLTGRFVRALDAALFGTQHPIEDITVFDDTSMRELIMQTIASMNSEQDALVSLDSAFSSEYDPFLFAIRGKNSPDGMTLEVTSKSQTLSEAFSTFAGLSPISASGLDAASLFQGSHDWAMRLTPTSKLTLTSAELPTLANCAPPIAKRAFDVARLLIAEGSREILARTPNGRIAGALGQVAAADPAKVAFLVEEALPVIANLDPADTVGELGNQISNHTRVAIDAAIGRALATTL